MTWHHPILALQIATALYCAHRGSVCFGAAAVLLERAEHSPPTPNRRSLDRGAIRCLFESQGYALLTVALSATAGFVAGRL